MKVIRRGITRTVILTRHHAIKLPSLRRYGDGLAGVLWSFCRGVLANQCERTWYRNAADPALCPVLRSWLGGIINVYPRCEVLPDDYTGELPELMYVGRIGDTKPDNYGWLNGAIVRLDYDVNYNGCPHDRAGYVNQALAEATAP